VSNSSASSGDADTPVRLSATVRGRVQGVGFRWWVRSRALEHGLVGWASNLDDGRVEVVTEGPRSACEALLEQLRGDPASSTQRPPGEVSGVSERFTEARGGLDGFVER
jgi:acylphosphatase